MNKTITISSKVSARVAQLGKDQVIAYTFAKLLSSTVKHPIIFNHRANLTALRLLIGLSDATYRKQLNMALQLGYCTQEGKHLRLISKTQEKYQFNLRKRDKSVEIQTTHLKPFIELSAIEHNLRHQEWVIKEKLSADPKAKAICDNYTLSHSVKSTINPQITLSVSSAAKLLHCSRSCAHSKLTKLQAFGLTLLPNRVIIGMTEFKRILATAQSYNLRYNKDNSQYLYIGANLATVDNWFYKTRKQNFNPAKGLSYCSIDIG
jgi:hypothetical protein